LSRSNSPEELAKRIAAARAGVFDGADDIEGRARDM